MTLAIPYFNASSFFSNKKSSNIQVETVDRQPQKPSVSAFVNMMPVGEFDTSLYSMVRSDADIRQPSMLAVKCFFWC